MEFVHTEIKEHPLRDCLMLWIPELPFVPPLFGTKKELEEARVFAEQKAEDYLKSH